jgi:hypothetical protein
VPAFDDALRGENAERNRQIEGGTRLAYIGRRQVHRDTMGRELETGVADRAAHAVAAFSNTRIRQSHHRECWQAEGHVHFHMDRTGFDAEESRRTQACEHAGADTARRVAPSGSSRINELRESSESGVQIVRGATVAGVAVLTRAFQARHRKA